MARSREVDHMLGSFSNPRGAQKLRLAKRTPKAMRDDLSRPPPLAAVSARIARVNNPDERQATVVATGQLDGAHALLARPPGESSNWPRHPGVFRLGPQQCGVTIFEMGRK